MAEYLTMEEAQDKFGSKGKANAGLTLGIIGTALAGLGGGLFSNGLFGGGAATVNAVEGGPTVYETYKKQCGDAVELTRSIYDSRITDLKEKFDMYKTLEDKINALAVKDAQLEASLPLAMQLAAVNAERYADNKISNVAQEQGAVNFMFQRELDKKINGTMGLPWGDIITGIPTMPACTMGVTCPSSSSAS